MFSFDFFVNHADCSFEPPLNYILEDRIRIFSGYWDFYLFQNVLRQSGAFCGQIGRPFSLLIKGCVYFIKVFVDSGEESNISRSQAVSVRYCCVDNRRALELYGLVVLD